MIYDYTSISGLNIAKNMSMNEFLFLKYICDLWNLC